MLLLTLEWYLLAGVFVGSSRIGYYASKGKWWNYTKGCEATQKEIEAAAAIQARISQASRELVEKLWH